MEVQLSRGDDISMRQRYFLCGEIEILDGTCGPIDVKRRERPCERRPWKMALEVKGRKEEKFKVIPRLF